jgi:hypothetical protein
MDKLEALRVVSGIGLSYFWDEYPDRSIEAIIAWMTDHIRGTAQLSGLQSWKTRRDALRIVLHECAEQKLDRVVDQDFVPLEEIGGRGRTLLERVHQSIATAIHEREQVLEQ